MPGKLRPLAAVPLVVLLGAGCAHSPAESSGGNPATQVQPGPELRAKSLEYARCMRTNGVPDFPDPGANGVILFYGASDSAEFASAQRACTGIMPEGGTP